MYSFMAMCSVSFVISEKKIIYLVWLACDNYKSKPSYSYNHDVKTTLSPATFNRLLVNSQIINTTGFAGHMVSVTMTQFCHCRVKEATNNMETTGHGCVPNKALFTKTGRCLHLAPRYSMLEREEHWPRS